MNDDQDALSQRWGKAPFELPAGWLDLSPAATDLPSIERLMRTMPVERLFLRITGDGPAAGAPRRVGWDEITSLQERIASGQTLHAQAIDLHLHDAGFREVLQRFRQRLAGIVPAVGEPATKASIGLFLSSAGAVAPFHADMEHNFLSQVIGDKHIHMFPPSNLALFPAAARERLAAESIHILDTYSPEAEKVAEVVYLQPGMTIYHPPMGPHWVDTGRRSHSLSITLSFITPDVDRTLLLHKLNRQLRRLGVVPAAPGSRPLVDAAKWQLARVLRAGLRATRGGRAAADHTTAR